MTKRKKILFIVSRLPINTQTGDRLRVYHFIKKLAEKGHQVDVLGFVPAKNFTIRTDIKKITRQCIGIEKEGIEFESPSRKKQLQQFFESFTKGYPYRVWHWQDQAFSNKARELVNNHNYDVIHFSEVVTGIPFMDVQKMDDTPRIVFDLIDSVALSLKNALTKEISLLWPFRFIELHRLKRFEQEIAEHADKAVLISDRDKNFLGNADVTVIPNGIEENSLHQRTRDIDLLFTGNMAAEANIDAVRWFVENVMPGLRRTNPDVSLTIAGANPSDSIKALQSSRITITGFVQDMNVYYRRAKLFICPMRLGAGQKNKVLEAMINHTPVISTTEGNIGVDAPSDAIAIADDVDTFSRAVTTLLNDDEQRCQLAENGYQYVKKTFSWDRSVDWLEQCYEA